MVLKRKRNLKVDNTTIYRVFCVHGIEGEMLEDYIETHDSGMEADEEKEIHLQNIMMGINTTIPLPVIEKEENPAKDYYRKITLKKPVNITYDVKNKYVFSEEDEREIKRIGDGENIENLKNEIENGLVCLGDNPVKTNEINPSIANFILSRTILRYERPGYESYTCFRKRIFNPTFKLRRNENLVLEKLNRIFFEFRAIEYMLQLVFKRSQLEKKKIDITNKIIEKYNKMKVSEKKRAYYRKKILGKRICIKPIREDMLIDEIIKGRERIKKMRQQPLEISEPFIDEKYAKKIFKAMGLFKMKKYYQKRNIKK